MPTESFSHRRASFVLSALFSSLIALGSCSNVGSSSGTPTPLMITAAALPNGQVKNPYTSTLTATGGTVPYSWTLTSGTFPDGLSLDGTTGVISGTPTVSVAATALAFSVRDSASPSQTGSVNLSLTVVSSALAITTNFLPDGQVGSPYSTTLTAVGGSTPYSWQLTSGTLPAGLALNPASGVISGTPTANISPTSLSFKITDSANPAATAMVSLTLTMAAVPLVITTTGLPDAQTGVAYSAPLASAGGTGAVIWTISSGTLPAGLQLNASTGAITGIPGATVSATPLTFTATDSGTPAQTQSAAFTLTVNPAGTSVDVSPRRAALTLAQALALSATTNDPNGVTWSVSPAAGSFSPAASHNGAKVTFTAPSIAGVYTITATSVSDTSRSATLTVFVTDLTGVYTYHNDLARAGANTQEYALTATTVNASSFGKLFSCTVDGAVYAQPLWVANLSVAGIRHNMVFVATEHDSLYAFDADGTACTQLWKVSLIDATHGGSATETTVPAGAVGYLVGQGYGDIAPEVGVTGTPVIDPAASILYVVAKSVDASKTIFHQRLHAIDLATGAEKSAASPVNISATYPAAGGVTKSFIPQFENQRPGLALSGGAVWVSWASHEDVGPWYGWLLGYTYSPAAFKQSAVLNVAPNEEQAGIWMSGGAPSVDSSGHMYVITGNGTFNAATGDYADSFLQIDPTASGGPSVTSYFTPASQANDNLADLDFGSGGAALVLNLASGTPSHLVVGGGKDGVLYVLNGDNMGGSGDDSHAYQIIHVNAGVFATGAFWNNTLYLAPVSTPVLAYTFDPSARKFNTTLAMQTSNSFGFPGATASISSTGAASNGILWAIDSRNYCTPQSGGCGPAQLYAYSATALGTQLWNSATIGADAAGNAVKFTVPTIANGHVYIGTRGNNRGDGTGSTSKDGELDVYGLKPN